MKPKATACFIACLLTTAFSTADQARMLEANLKDHLPDSPEAAELMLALLNERTATEDVFGTIKTSSDFVRAQTKHPQRAEIMILLIEAYAAVARHSEVIATGRQFHERFQDSPQSLTVHQCMAEAYEKINRWHDAAFHWTPIALTGNAVATKHALDLFDRAENAQAARDGADFTAALLRNLSSEPWSTAAALRGMDLANRGERWETGSDIARLALKGSTNRSRRATATLWFRLGEFESRRGNHAIAVSAIEKSLDEEHVDRWSTYLRELRAAKSDPTRIERNALEMAKLFPNHNATHHAVIQSCDAWLDIENHSKAISLLEKVLRNGEFSRDIARKLLELCGEDHRRAERVLLEILGKKNENDAALREIIAIDLYQHRIKDSTKSRKMATDWLEKSPSAHGAERIVACLIDQSSTESSVTSDLNLITRSAIRNLEISNYTDELWRWRSGDAKRAEQIDHAKRNFMNHPLVRLWQRAEKGKNDGADACEELLKNPITSNQKKWAMLRLAYLNRHEMGDTSRANAHQQYKTYCKANPMDWTAAEAWLEAACHADDEARLEAARHLIKIPPAPVHHDSHIRLIETGDPSHRIKAADWSSKAVKLTDLPFNHASRIGRILFDAGLKNEAYLWWRTHYEANSTETYATDCLIQHAGTLEPNEAIALLQPAFRRPDAMHGPLAMALAEYHFRNGEFSKFATVLAETRRRADDNPYIDWHVGEWPAKGWLDHTSQSADITNTEKALVYRAIFDLRLGRLSAEAGLMWAASQKPSWQRATDTQRAMRMADRHHDAWQRLYPCASNAILRRDMTLAAAILNGLLNSVGGVDEKESERARARLRTAYARMGSLGTDIPDDSPISPLIEIVLHLRLGDKEAAGQSYFKQLELFDQHVSELPVELILFAAETHIDLGTEENHQRAEELLRGWLIHHTDSDQVSLNDKARTQLLLAKNYLTSQNYDVARAEYTSLINLYPDESEAIDARFGIGETFLAQGIEDQADEIFNELANNSDPRVVIRADFMRGVLAIRRDDPEQARNIFLNILEKAPDVDLADSTLYQLAEVYGIEQRYLAQLETLRTVGRLGRESQRWLTPGKALAIVVQDPDLGISRGEMKIPVRITTEPGGDVEQSFLTSGGAGRGIFLTDIPTTLGPAIPNDGVLQVTGADLIHVDYPDEFKAQFQNQILEGTRIRIATDAQLDAASSELADDDGQALSESLPILEDDAPTAVTLAEQRPNTQVKPGNLIHVRVRDGDQDRSDQPDQVAVKLETSSGDVVRVSLRENAAHGGVFSGSIRTGELPAGAHASDTALDHSPLMAIDQRRNTAWRSEPDGKTPKFLTVDMKEPKPVERIILESPTPDREMPTEIVLHGSQDGRFWFKLGEHPAIEADALPDSTDKNMIMRVFPAPKDGFKKDFSWNDLVAFAKTTEPSEQMITETLRWQPPADGESMHLVVWSGPLVQTRTGSMRFSITGRHNALMFNGRLELPLATGTRTVDVHAEMGIHQLAIVSMVAAGDEPAAAQRARENRDGGDVILGDFSFTDFDLTKAGGLERIIRPIGGTLTRENSIWTLEQPTIDIRHLKWQFNGFNGNGVAVNHITIAGGESTHIPTTPDVLELAGNNTLELAPGDTITVSYLDEVGADGNHRNRLLTQTLTATYSDGRITPITHTFERGNDGSIQQNRHQLLRIEPGDRIVAEVTDYDLDRTLKCDEVTIEVEAPDGTRTSHSAMETGPTTGIFIAEIETASMNLQPGDRVILRYQDDHNNFPGHPYIREAVILVNQPGDASLRIIASSTKHGLHPELTPDVIHDGPSEVSLNLPLTVEVIDPGRALHSGSRINIELETTQGNRATVECILSTAHSTIEDALQIGRFIGQAPLQLGSVNCPKSLPIQSQPHGSLLGRIIVADEDEVTPKGMQVLNVLGNDIITARYSETQGSSNLEATAVFRTAGELGIYDESYATSVDEAFLGKRIHLQIVDPDLDVSDGRDTALVRITTDKGEEEILELRETLNHSGIFNASFPLVANQQPNKGNPDAGIECFFGDTLRISYLDNVPHNDDGTPVIEHSVVIAMGTDGSVTAFSKAFRDEEMAIQTQFHIAECHFELFKSHRALERDEEAMLELEAGRDILRELSDDFPDPKHQPRVQYLLGQFAQELKDWDEAITCYQTVIHNHPRHPLAPEALYKMGQCHEESGNLDEALENYANLAATYPKSPLISNVMLRISEHFYQQENYDVAASVGRKFLERFPTHEWAPRMAFRVGQAHYKNEDYAKAAIAFDQFMKQFPEDALSAQALFWAGESYRMAGNLPEAFRRYNRCRWDFPESDAAKYSRGRLALPELLSEFDRQANLGE